MTDQYTEANTPFFPTAIKHGLIIGVLAIIVSLAVQLAGLASNMMLMMFVGILFMFLYVFAGFRAIKEHRDDQLEGQITFGRAFATGLVATLVACFVASAFSVIYTVYIDPNAAQEAMDAASDMMEKLGADEDAIEMAMKNAEDQFKKPLRMFINNFGVASIIGAIGTLILAAILKRDSISA